MTLLIRQIGTAVPDTVIDRASALAIARALACGTQEQETWLPSMYTGTLIDTRRMALPADLLRDVIEGTKLSGSVFLPSEDPDDRGPTTAERMAHYVELAPPLALGACREAIAGSGVEAHEFTHLVTVSCTGFFAPGIDYVLVSGLGLPATIQRTHVGYMGCHGALNGLRVAQAFASDPRARVLLCAVELCSLHYHYSYNPSKMIANAIFGDGAAAVVGTGGGLPADGPAPWRVLATGSCYLPNSERAMTWNIGDNGFEMTLTKNVPSLILRHLRPWLEAWLAEVGVGLGGVRSWAIHPGGPRILTAVEEAIGLTPSDTTASREVFADMGNMSSPTVLFILRKLIERDAPRPCLMLGFGPGLVAEAVLVG
jgi:predicted naringenin-chalcone synthase